MELNRVSGYYQPSDVQREDVSGEDTTKDRRDDRFTPEIPGNHRGEEAPEDQNKWDVILPLEHDNWIGFEVVQVDGFASSDNVRMLFD